MKRSRRRSSSLTRTEDISRLMDPSYLPHSSSSASSSPVSVHAWVDDHGDLHDPDYRDFPILAATTARRPHWESSNSTYEVVPSSTSSHRPVSPRERRKARYDAEYALYATSAPSYGSGSTSTSHAYDEVDAPLPPSPRRRKLRALSPRRSSDSTPEALDIERFWLEEDAETVEEPKKEYIPSRHQADLTPSCSDQIRRQWQTFALSVRFSLFRAQRRLHRRLSAT